MKPSTRIICLAGLLLSLLSSCQQTAGSKSELSLKAAAFNQEDAAIAKQFGYSSDPLIFQFTTGQLRSIAALYGLYAESGTMGSPMDRRSKLIRPPRPHRRIYRRTAERLYIDYAMR